jgi:hypothetical protein
VADVAGRTIVVDQPAANTIDAAFMAELRRFLAEAVQEAFPELTIDSNDRFLVSGPIFRCWRARTLTGSARSSILSRSPW